MPRPWHHRQIRLAVPFAMPAAGRYRPRSGDTARGLPARQAGVASQIHWPGCAAEDWHKRQRDSDICACVRRGYSPAHASFQGGGRVIAPSRVNATSTRQPHVNIARESGITALLTRPLKYQWNFGQQRYRIPLTHPRQANPHILYGRCPCGEAHRNLGVGA